MECRLKSNSGLPRSTAPPGAESAYVGFYSTSNILDSNGLFNGLKACEGASSVAHSYDCSTVIGRRKRSTLTTTADLEHELARVLQSGGSNAAVSSTVSSQNVTKTKLEPFEVNERKGEIPEQLQKVITGTVQSQSKKVSYNFMLEHHHYINYTVNGVYTSIVSSAVINNACLLCLSTAASHAIMVSQKAMGRPNKRRVSSFATLAIFLSQYSNTAAYCDLFSFVAKVMGIRIVT